jgi:uncharacterized damage-inducible protein DinB
LRLIDPMLMEFDREASTTRKLLERMPDDRLAWKPHPKSMTLQDLSWHLATIPAWVAAGVLLDVPVPSIYGPTADENPFRKG